MNGGKSQTVCIVRGRSRELSMGHQGVLDDTTAEHRTSPVGTSAREYIILKRRSITSESFTGMTRN